MKRIRVGFMIVTITVALLAMTHSVGVEPAGPASGIFPTPQHFVGSGTSGTLSVNNIKAIRIPPECHDAVGALDLVNARLAELKLNALRADETAGLTLEAGYVHAGIVPNAALEERLAALPKPYAEGYRLLVDKGAAYILGADVAGLYHGMISLSQLVDEKGQIPCVSVSDWPDLPLRGTYMAGSAGLKERILQCAALKMNFMMFECGEFFDMANPTIRARWEEAFALCRKHFIEPVPELQSFGWGQFVLAAHPGAAEGVFVDKARFEVKDNVIQAPDPPLAPAADIKNAGFEDADSGPVPGWSVDGRGEGITIERNGAHSGQGCLAMTRTEKGLIRVWQTVAVLPNHRYQVSCFAKVKEVTTGSAYIEVYGLNPDGSLGDWMSHPAVLQGTQDWQRSTLDFESGTYERVQIYVRLQDGVGTAWFDDVTLTGTAAINPLTNVLLTPSAPLVVQDESGATTYEEGKDYRLTPGETAFPFEHGTPTRIELVPNGRIKNGSVVLLSFQQAPQGSITCCPSEPLYQEFMRKTIHTVVECLKPKYLHIGHDEPRVLNRDRRCTARNMSNSELFVDDIKRMLAYAREASPSIRLMMWSDAVNPYHNGPSLNMNDAAAMIPRDIIQCPWWYAYPDGAKRIENSVKFFLELGFDITGSPWFDGQNVMQWADTLRGAHLTNSHVLGLIYTSWSDTTQDPWQSLITAAQYSWHQPEK